MRAEAENGLIYDDTNPLCWLTLSRAQGENYAFIQVIEAKWPEQTKRYWGKWDAGNPQASLQNIMLDGGKWPDLIE